MYYPKHRKTTLSLKKQDVQQVVPETSDSTSDDDSEKLSIGSQHGTLKEKKGALVKMPWRHSNSNREKPRKKFKTPFVKKATKEDSGDESSDLDDLTSLISDSDDGTQDPMTLVSEKSTAEKTSSRRSHLYGIGGTGKRTSKAYNFSDVDKMKRIDPAPSCSLQSEEKSSTETNNRKDSPKSDTEKEAPDSDETIPESDLEIFDNDPEGDLENETQKQDAENEEHCTRTKGEEELSDNSQSFLTQKQDEAGVNKTTGTSNKTKRSVISESKTSSNFSNTENKQVVDFKYPRFEYIFNSSSQHAGSGIGSKSQNMKSFLDSVMGTKFDFLKLCIEKVKQKREAETVVISDDDSDEDKVSYTSMRQNEGDSEPQLQKLSSDDTLMYSYDGDTEKEKANSTSMRQNEGDSEPQLQKLSSDDTLMYSYHCDTDKEKERQRPNSPPVGFNNGKAPVQLERTDTLVLGDQSGSPSHRNSCTFQSMPSLQSIPNVFTLNAEMSLSPPYLSTEHSKIDPNMVPCTPSPKNDGEHLLQNPSSKGEDEGNIEMCMFSNTDTEADSDINNQVKRVLKDLQGTQSQNDLTSSSKNPLTVSFSDKECSKGCTDGLAVARTEPKYDQGENHVCNSHTEKVCSASDVPTSETHFGSISFTLPDAENCNPEGLAVAKEEPTDEDQHVEISFSLCDDIIQVYGSDDEELFRSQSQPNHIFVSDDEEGDEAEEEPIVDLRLKQESSLWWGDNDDDDFSDKDDSDGGDDSDLHVSGTKSGSDYVCDKDEHIQSLSKTVSDLSESKNLNEEPEAEENEKCSSSVVKRNKKTLELTEDGDNFTVKMDLNKTYDLTKLFLDDSDESESEGSGLEKQEEMYDKQTQIDRIASEPGCDSENKKEFEIETQPDNLEPDSDGGEGQGRRLSTHEFDLQTQVDDDKFCTSQEGQEKMMSDYIAPTQISNEDTECWGGFRTGSSKETAERVMDEYAVQTQIDIPLSDSDKEEDDQGSMSEYNMQTQMDPLGHESDRGDGQKNHFDILTQKDKGDVEEDGMDQNENTNDQDNPFEMETLLDSSGAVEEVSDSLFSRDTLIDEDDHGDDCAASQNQVEKISREKTPISHLVQEFEESFGNSGDSSGLQQKLPVQTMAYDDGRLFSKKGSTEKVEASSGVSRQMLKKNDQKSQGQACSTSDSKRHAFSSKHTSSTKFDTLMKGTKVVNKSSEMEGRGKRKSILFDQSKTKHASPSKRSQVTQNKIELKNLMKSPTKKTQMSPLKTRLKSLTKAQSRKPKTTRKSSKDEASHLTQTIARAKEQKNQREKGKLEPKPDPQKDIYHPETEDVSPPSTQDMMNCGLPMINAVLPVDKKRLVKGLPSQGIHPLPKTSSLASIISTSDTTSMSNVSSNSMTTMPQRDTNSSKASVSKFSDKDKPEGSDSGHNLKMSGTEAKYDNCEKLKSDFGTDKTLNQPSTSERTDILKNVNDRYGTLKRKTPPADALDERSRHDIGKGTVKSAALSHGNDHTSTRDPTKSNPASWVRDLESTNVKRIKLNDKRSVSLQGTREREDTSAKTLEQVGQPFDSDRGMKPVMEKPRPILKHNVENTENRGATQSQQSHGPKTSAGILKSFGHTPDLNVADRSLQPTEKSSTSKVNFNTALNKMKYIEGRISDPGLAQPSRQPKERKDGVLKKDDIVFKILTWNAIWLSEKASHTSNLPDLNGNGNKYSQVRMSYDDIVSYQKITMNLFMLEVWETVCEGWDNGTALCLKVIQRNVPKKDESGLLNIEVQGLVGNEERHHIPQKDDVLFVNMQCKWKENMEKAAECRPQFGMVHSVQIHYKDSSDFSKEIRDAFPSANGKKTTSFRMTMKIKYKGFIITENILHIQVLTSLVSALRQYQALVELPKSPLCNELVSANPLNLRYPATIPEEHLYRLNKEQAEAVKKITWAVLNPAQKPNICLLQGPPGTGKSHTIVALVLHILKKSNFKAKICLATSSNAAVDEIASRIIRFSAEKSPDREKNNTPPEIRIVRIGVFEKVLPSVNPWHLYSWTDKQFEEEQMQHLSPSLREEIKCVKKGISNCKKILSKRTISEVEKCKTEGELRKLIKQKENLDCEAGGMVIAKTMHKRQRYRVQCEVMDRAHIVCGTLNSFGMGCVKEIALRTTRDAKRGPYFDCLIIDEATQAIEMDCLIPLQYGMPKIVLVGDQKQLPATIKSKKARDLQLDCSLFQRIDKKMKAQQHPFVSPIMTLKTQYRMHPEILALPNSYFYDNHLVCDDSIKSKETVLSPYLVFDLQESKGTRDSGTKSYSNKIEAECVAELCQEIGNLKVMDPSLKRHLQIGVICFYTEQKKAILSLIRDENVDVNTIDSFQGQERDVIIISCVRADSHARSIGFLEDDKRMNVALTRAKKALYIVGHFQTLKSNRLWEGLYKDAQERKRYINVMRQNDFRSVAKQAIRVPTGKQSSK